MRAVGGNDNATVVVQLSIERVASKYSGGGYWSGSAMGDGR